MSVSIALSLILDAKSPNSLTIGIPLLAIKVMIILALPLAFCIINFITLELKLAISRRSTFSTGLTGGFFPVLLFAPIILLRDVFAFFIPPIISPIISPVISIPPLTIPDLPVAALVIPEVPLSELEPGVLLIGLVEHETDVFLGDQHIPASVALDGLFDSRDLLHFFDDHILDLFVFKDKDPHILRIDFVESGELLLPCITNAVLNASGSIIFGLFRGEFRSLISVFSSCSSLAEWPVESFFSFNGF
jgi:hypothetical protein